MSAANVIAATFGWDVQEAKEAEYQAGKYKIKVFTIGELYYCTSRTPPKNLCGLEWKKAHDQFFAGEEKTILWESVQ